MDSQTQQLVRALQGKCLHKGVGALKQLSCIFRKLDIDYSKRICFEELSEGLQSFGMDLSHAETVSLFEALDKDGNGSVDFKEFMDLLTPPMDPIRVAVINQAFDKMDVNKDEVLKMDDLKSEYEWMNVWSTWIHLY